MHLLTFTNYRQNDYLWRILQDLELGKSLTLWSIIEILTCLMSVLILNDNLSSSNTDNILNLLSYLFHGWSVLPAFLQAS